MTPKDGLRDLKTSRLAAHIAVLRNLGFPIITERRTEETSDPTGRKATYAVYTLERRFVDQENESLHEFMQLVELWRVEAINKRRGCSNTPDSFRPGNSLPERQS